MAIRRTQLMRLTAGCGGESDNGEELGKGHCYWKRTGGVEEPRRPGSFVSFNESLYTMSPPSEHHVRLCTERRYRRSVQAVQKALTAQIRASKPMSECVFTSLINEPASSGLSLRLSRTSRSKLTFIPVSYILDVLGVDTVDARTGIRHWSYAVVTLTMKAEYRVNL